jgi:Cu2+-containing amine oxidase
MAPSFSKVKIYSNWQGIPRLTLESFYRIGNYRLIQKWIFAQNGWIYPRLLSSGLQYPADHRHHVYWRFDFDIDGSTNDLVLEYNSNTPNLGYGPGWHKKTVEIMRRKNPSFSRSWAIADKQSWRGYHIIPGANDGTVDSFSNQDLWIMRYRYNEDKHGNQGSAYGDDLIGYINGEAIDGQDVVLWYCAHLNHHAAEGGDEWHWAGPYLAPFRNWWQ